MLTDRLTFGWDEGREKRRTTTKRLQDQMCPSIPLNIRELMRWDEGRWADGPQL